MSRIIPVVEQIPSSFRIDLKMSLFKWDFKFLMDLGEVKSDYRVL